MSTPLTNSKPRPEWQPLLALTLLSTGLNAFGFQIGFFFDDNNHLERCAKNGFAGLASGNTFYWNRDILRAWWAADDMSWAYFRPLAVFLRTLQLQVFGLNPVPFHAVYLTLYTSVILLFYGLLRRLKMSQTAAFIGAMFFTLHPTQPFIGGWLASDGAMLSGLGFVLGFWAMHASHVTNHSSWLLRLGVLGSYAIAVSARESGIILGPLLLIFDWMLAGRTLKNRPWGLYTTLALEGVAYLGIRAWCLEPGLLPREPYIYWPSRPGFWTWLPYKLLGDLASIPWGLPLVPIFGVPWLQARPVTTAVLVLTVIAAIGLFLWPLRRSWAAWSVVAGTALAALPTIHVFAAPYNCYFVVAGWACVLALWTERRLPDCPRLVWRCLTGLAVVYLGGQWASMWMLQAGSNAQESIVAEILADGAADYPPNTKIFLVDVPVFAAEAGPAVRLKTGRQDLEVFALTFSPTPFALRTITTVYPEGPNVFGISRMEEGWFGPGIGEKLHLAWFGATRETLTPGEYDPRPAAGDLPFRVGVGERAEQGIRYLQFRFEKPLDDPHYRFFIATGVRSAQPWRFHTVGAAPASPELQLANQRMGRFQIAASALIKAIDKLP